jgi:hypothetical protein
LPYCKPELGIETKRRPSGIGEILEGHELRNSGFKLHFASNTYTLILLSMCNDMMVVVADVNHEDLCDMILTRDAAQEFTSAVEQQVIYNSYYVSKSYLTYDLFIYLFSVLV